MYKSIGKAENCEGAQMRGILEVIILQLITCFVLMFTLTLHVR